MEEDAFFAKLGSIKGLSEIALAIKHSYHIQECPDDINKLGDHLARVSPVYMLSLETLSNAARQEELLQIHTICRWADHGMPVFDLTHSLMAALLLTDPSDVDAADVRLPFPTFAIRFPDGFWSMKGISENTMGVPHALVHTYYARTSKSPVPMPMLCLRIVGKLGTTTTWEITHVIPEAGKIREWVADDVPEVSDPTYGVVAPDAHDKSLTVALRRLLVNLCLYISAHGKGERPGRHVSKKRKKAPDPVNVPNVWIVGREVKLDSELISSAKAWTESRGSQREGWRVRSRFTVRGHWRNQPIGVKRSDHKLIWIAPHWRGQGPKFSHLYTSDSNPPNGNDHERT